MSKNKSLGHAARDILATARKSIQAVPRPGTTDRTDIKNVPRPEDERDGEEATRQQQIQKKIIDEGSSADRYSKKKVTCPDCEGKKRDNCNRCDGKGWVWGQEGKGSIDKQNTGWKSRAAWIKEQDDQPEVEEPDEKDCECKHDKKKDKKGKTKVDINPEIDNNIFASHEEEGELVEQKEKSKDREVGTKSLAKTYADDTPGQRLDELGDKVLDRYRYKAVRDVGTQTINALRNDDKKALKKAQNRQKGIKQARLRMQYRKEETELNEVDLVKLQYQNKSGQWITAREVTNNTNQLYIQMRNLQQAMEHQRVRAIGPRGELLDLWGPDMETDIPYKSGYTPVKVVEGDLQELSKALLNRFIEKNGKTKKGKLQANDRVKGRYFAKPPKDDPLSQYSGVRNVKKYHPEETQLHEISKEKLNKWFNGAYVAARYGRNDGPPEYKKHDKYLNLAGAKLDQIKKTGSSVINKKGKKKDD